MSEIRVALHNLNFSLHKNDTNEVVLYQLNFIESLARSLRFLHYTMNTAEFMQVISQMLTLTNISKLAYGLVYISPNDIY